MSDTSYYCAAFQEKVNQCLAEIRQELTERGKYTDTSCDTTAFGWDRDKHHALMSIYRACPPDFHLDYAINHGVWDWSAYPKVTVQ